MSEKASTILLLSVFSFLLVMGFTVFLFRKVFRQLWQMIRSRTRASVVADPVAPHAFRLEHVFDQEKPHLLCLRFFVESSQGSRSGHGARPRAGLACAYRVSVDGREVAAETVGYGAVPPRPHDRRINTTFFNKSSCHGVYTEQALMVLCRLEGYPCGARILAEGNLRFDEETRPGEMVVSWRA
jgi:hypothetical protein